MINSLKYQSQSPRALVTMQTLHSVRSRQQWTLNEKKIALSLFYKSPTTYSLKDGLAIQNFYLDITNNFNQIKLKTETLTANEKYFIVAFDEMKIKTFLEYSKPLDLV